MMSRSSRTTALHLTLVATAALALGACGAAEEALTERVVEEAAGGDVDIELDDEGGVTRIETEDGSLDIGTGAEMPDEWPDDVPTYDGGEITGSFASAGTVLITYTTMESGSEVVESMLAELEAAGFTIDSTTNIGGADSLAMVVAQRGELAFSLSAAGGSEDGSTQVQIAVATQV